jgi:CheY-like chemotaxis protein
VEPERDTLASDDTAVKEHRGRALVAEDNIINQKVTARMMEKRGFEVDVVENGLEALAALERYPYDIVLMDCQMPEMDGYQATREIRRQEGLEDGRRHIPVIAVTANAMVGDDEKCYAAGMDEYLTKPVNPEKLDAVLEKWIPWESVLS